MVSNSALDPLIMTFFQFGILIILLGWLLTIQSTSLTGRNIVINITYIFPI